MNNQKSLCCYGDIKPTFGDGPEACSQCGRIIGAELPAKTTEELIEEATNSILLTLKAGGARFRWNEPEVMTKTLTQLAKAVENNVHTQSALEAKEEERERIGKDIFDQLDNTPKIKALKSISLAFRDMVIKAITKK
ncbi:hypothetical protein ACGYLM_01460 [Sulfitobacter sp. 1A10445]|uniref:hypothetical protein n=1 Tax=unclassified Sulfitobacter TaxID=196795 RepID=UPI00374620AA